MQRGAAKHEAMSGSDRRVQQSGSGVRSQISDLKWARFRQNPRDWAVANSERWAERQQLSSP
jgi:hypothetical protein